MKPSTVSRVIPELLDELGWSKETLAEQLGLPVSAIETHLSPGFSPSARTLARTCKSLGYDVIIAPAGTEVEGGYKITE